MAVLQFAVIDDDIINDVIKLTSEVELSRVLKEAQRSPREGEAARAWSSKSRKRVVLFDG